MKGEDANKAKGRLPAKAHEHAPHHKHKRFHSGAKVLLLGLRSLWLEAFRFVTAFVFRGYPFSCWQVRACTISRANFSWSFAATLLRSKTCEAHQSSQPAKFDIDSLACGIPFSKGAWDGSPSVSWIPCISASQLSKRTTGKLSTLSTSKQTAWAAVAKEMEIKILALRRSAEATTATIVDGTFWGNHPSGCRREAADSSIWTWWTAVAGWMWSKNGGNYGSQEFL